MSRPPGSTRSISFLLSLALVAGLAASGSPVAAATAARFDVGNYAAAPPSQNGAPDVAATGIGGDIPGLRTQSSDTYPTNPTTGAYTTQIFLSSINYRDATDTWQPIDNSLIPTSTAGYAYQNTANRYTALFPDNLAAAPIKISRGSAAVAFALTGAKGPVETKGATATYANALPGVNVVYTARNDDVAEDLILANADAAHTFEYAVQPGPGLLARANGQGGIEFVDRAGAIQLSFAAPTLADAAGISPNVPVTLNLTRPGGDLVVSFGVDAAWLADPTRVWPVTIDPVVVVASSRSCVIGIGSAGNPHSCRSTSLLVGSDGSTVFRTLVGFSLASIPASATVLDAQLQLYLVDSCGCGMEIVDVLEPVQEWGPGVTWKTFDGSTAWTTAGGAVAAPPLHETEMHDLNQTYSWPVTSYIQGAIGHTIVDNGFLLRTADETIRNRWTFSGAEGSNAPVLSVTWQP